MEIVRNPPRRRRVCFVTYELYPFTGGGIGTWLANTLATYQDGPADFELVFCGPAPSPDAFARTYPGVKLYCLDLERPDPAVTLGRTADRHNFRSFAHWRSFLLMCKLEQIERDTGPFDVIEFIDWCGAAFFSLNAKRIGRSFQQTMLSVRLHATESVLRDYETRPWSMDNLVIADLERAALADADQVIAHLPSTADVFQRHFKFPAAWRERCIVSLPPVIGSREPCTIRVGPDTSVLFTSKIQAIKRPQLFARGVAGFMAASPDWKGLARFLAFDVDSTLRQHCEAAIPFDQRGRFVFGGPASRPEREAIIRDAVVVFPGVFEAFCFAAYEASLNGAVVVLNARNPAFGPGSPWRPGHNCLGFDGSSADLTRVLNGLFADPDAHPLVPVDVPHDPSPYWEHESPPALSEATRLTLGAAIIHRYEGTLLHGTLDSLLHGPDRIETMVIATEASGEPSADLVLAAVQQLAEERPDDLVLIRHAHTVFPGLLVAAATEALRTDLVAIVPAGFELVPGFLDLAVRALSANPDHDVVLPAVRTVDEHDRLRPLGYWVPLGASVHAGLFVNLMSPGPFVARRSFLQDFAPDETLVVCFHWDMLLRGAYAGRRYLVTDEPGFETVARVLHDYDAHTEQELRETIETIRSRFHVEGEGARFSLSLMADANPLSVNHTFGLFNVAPLQAEIDDLRGQVDMLRRERDEAAERARMLSDATSVKLALRAASRVQRMAPALGKSLRALLRR
jgi:hypothetical protein